MTDLVSTPPAPQSPENSSVVTPAFWPDVDVNGVRAQVNLGGEIPHDRLVESIRDGAIAIMEQLAAWQADQVEAGYATLAAVPPVVLVDAKTRLELLFLSAVAAFAAGRLAERNPDLTATREGSERGDQRRDMAAGFYADATRKVRAIQGKARIAAELV